MEITSVHKYVSLSKLADGTTEVLFAGQPCLTVNPVLEETFIWHINPVFAKLVYGANVIQDVPYCTESYDSIEEAVAGGLLKLFELGAFNTEVDLPSDSYADAKDEIMEDVKQFAISSTANLVEAATVYKKNIAKYLVESRNIPLEGHPYHEKTDEALRYIIKDAGEASRAMRDVNPAAESKYLDQMNDASTVLWYRKQNNLEGTVKESVDADYEKWQSAVQKAHPDKKLKFKGYVESGKDNISAEDETGRTHGVWDNDKNEGHVFSLDESTEVVVERELTPAEVDKKEEIVKALKKDKKFISKFGVDGLYAVATAKAKESA